MRPSEVFKEGDKTSDKIPLLSPKPLQKEHRGTEMAKHHSMHLGICRRQGEKSWSPHLCPKEEPTILKSFLRDICYSPFLMIFLKTDSSPTRFPLCHLTPPVIHPGCPQPGGRRGAMSLSTQRRRGQARPDKGQLLKPPHPSETQSRAKTNLPTCLTVFHIKLPLCSPFAGLVT